MLRGVEPFQPARPTVLILTVSPAPARWPCAPRYSRALQHSFALPVFLCHRDIPVPIRHVSTGCRVTGHRVIPLPVIALSGKKPAKRSITPRLYDQSCKTMSAIPIGQSRAQPRHHAKIIVFKSAGTNQPAQKENACRNDRRFSLEGEVRSGQHMCPPNLRETPKSCLSRPRCGSDRNPYERSWNPNICQHHQRDRQTRHGPFD